MLFINVFELVFFYNKIISAIKRNDNCIVFYVLYSVCYAFMVHITIHVLVTDVQEVYGTTKFNVGGPTVRPIKLSSISYLDIYKDWNQIAAYFLFHCLQS